MFSLASDKKPCVDHTLSKCAVGLGYTPGSAFQDNASCEPCVAGKFKAVSDDKECQAKTVQSPCLGGGSASGSGSAGGAGSTGGADPINWVFKAGSPVADDDACYDPNAPPSFGAGYPRIIPLDETSFVIESVMKGAGDAWNIYYIAELDGNGLGGYQGKRRQLQQRRSLAVNGSSQVSRWIKEGKSSAGRKPVIGGRFVISAEGAVNVTIGGLPRGGAVLKISMVAEDAAKGILGAPVVSDPVTFPDTSAPFFRPGFPRLSTSMSALSSGREKAYLEIEVDDGIPGKPCVVHWVAVLKDPQAPWADRDDEVAPLAKKIDAFWNLLTAEQRAEKASLVSSTWVGATLLSTADVHAGRATAGIDVFRAGSVNVKSTNENASIGEASVAEVMLDSLPEGKDIALFLTAEDTKSNAVPMPTRVVLDRTSRAPTFIGSVPGRAFGAAGIPVEMHVNEKALAGSVQLIFRPIGAVTKGEGGTEAIRIILSPSFESMGPQATVLFVDDLTKTPVRSTVTNPLGRTILTYTSKKNDDVQSVDRVWTNDTARIWSVASRTGKAAAVGLKGGVLYDITVSSQDSMGNPPATARYSKSTSTSTPTSTVVLGVTAATVAPDIDFKFDSIVGMSSGDHGGSSADGGGSAGGAGSTGSAMGGGPGSVGSSSSTTAAGKLPVPGGVESIQLKLSHPGTLFWVALPWDADPPTPLEIVQGMGNGGTPAMKSGVVDMGVQSDQQAVARPENDTTAVFDGTSLTNISSTTTIATTTTTTTPSSDATAAQSRSKYAQIQLPRYDQNGIAYALYMASTDDMHNIAKVTVSIPSRTCKINMLYSTLSSNGVSAQEKAICYGVVVGLNGMLIKASGGVNITERRVIAGMNCPIFRDGFECNDASCATDGSWAGGECREYNMASDLQSQAIMSQQVAFDVASIAPKTNLAATNLSVAPALLSPVVVKNVEQAAESVVVAAVVTAVVSSVTSAVAAAAGGAAAAAGVATGASVSIAAGGAGAGGAMGAGAGGGAAGGALPLVLTMQALAVTTRLKVIQGMGSNSTYKRIFESFGWTNLHFENFPFNQDMIEPANMTIDNSTAELRAALVKAKNDADLAFTVAQANFAMSLNVAGNASKSAAVAQSVADTAAVSLAVADALASAAPGVDTAVVEAAAKASANAEVAKVAVDTATSNLTIANASLYYYYDIYEAGVGAGNQGVSADGGDSTGGAGSTGDDAGPIDWAVVEKAIAAKKEAAAVQLEAVRALESADQVKAATEASVVTATMGAAVQAKIRAQAAKAAADQAVIESTRAQEELDKAISDNAIEAILVAATAKNIATTKAEADTISSLHKANEAQTAANFEVIDTAKEVATEAKSSAQAARVSIAKASANLARATNTLKTLIVDQAATVIVESAKEERLAAEIASTRATKELFDTNAAVVSADAAVIEATVAMAGDTTIAVDEARASAKAAAGVLAKARVGLETAVVGGAATSVVDAETSDKEEAATSDVDTKKSLDEVLKRKAAADSAVVIATAKAAFNIRALAAAAKAIADAAHTARIATKAALDEAYAEKQANILLDICIADRNAAATAQKDAVKVLSDASAAKSASDASVVKAHVDHEAKIQVEVQWAKDAAATASATLLLAKTKLEKASADGATQSVIDVMTNQKRFATSASTDADINIADAHKSQAVAATGLAQAVADNAADAAAQAGVDLDTVIVAGMSTAVIDAATTEVKNTAAASANAVNTLLLAKATKNTTVATVIQVNKDAAASAKKKADAINVEAITAAATLANANVVLEKALSNGMDATDINMAGDAMLDAVVANIGATMTLAGANKEQAAAEVSLATAIYEQTSGGEGTDVKVSVWATFK